MSGECVLINEPLNLHVKPGRPTGLLHARVERSISTSARTTKANTSRRSQTLSACAITRSRASRAAQGRGRRGVVLVQLPPRASAEPAGSDPRPVRLPVCPVVRRGVCCRVVFVVRHPLAVVSSHKRLGWKQHTHLLLDLPLLARDRLGPFRAELEEIAAFPDDIVWNASLLWRIVNSPALELQKRSAAVTVVRHEDLRNPREVFEKLYRTLGLELSDRVRSAISRSTAPDNPRRECRQCPRCSARQSGDPDHLERSSEQRGDRAHPLPHQRYCAALLPRRARLEG